MSARSKNATTWADYERGGASSPGRSGSVSSSGLARDEEASLLGPDDGDDEGYYPGRQRR